MTTAAALDEQIDAQRNNIRTDKLDITFGELSTMYENGELVISPDYQRLFRWETEQKTKFVESILLGFPVPAIFVAETGDGIWELVDGLQRVSTVLEFLGTLRSPDGAQKPPLVLAVVARKPLLSLLDGLTFEQLSLRSRLSIKRASCRVEVIKVGSLHKMKYEVFERLNTGGAGLSDQEIRNCVFRADSPEFMNYVDELARIPSFADPLGISRTQLEAMYDRGLVLRFFTLKNNMDAFQHDVEPYITEYVRAVVEGALPFNRELERNTFERTFAALSAAFDGDDDVWRHYRDGKHRGGFSVYVFDALSVGVARNIDAVSGLAPAELRERCLRVKTDATFRENVGSGANTKTKMMTRMAVADGIIGGRSA